ncbi:MAG: hypothetical protein GY845_11470 [Planctomycetes bacterium]|nr:hypothetical protein [Planctomycetota bacterium]
MIIKDDENIKPMNEGMMSKKKSRAANVTVAGLLIMTAALAVIIGSAMGLPLWVIVVLVCWGILSTGVGIIFAKKREKT